MNRTKSREHLNLFTRVACCLFLFKTANYLLARIQYRGAEAFFLRALHIREQVLTPSHPDVARSLDRLALR